MALTRRELLRWSGLLSGAATLGGLVLWQRQPGAEGPLLLSARNDTDGHHYAVGYHLNGRKAFATRVPERCHAIAPHPFLPVALFVGRRPSTESYLVHLQSGELLQTLHSEPDRHFYGHAVFHHSGEWLYATENDTTDPGRGVLGIYHLDGLQLRHHDEVPTHGIGPHELAWMPDGDTLAVCNGGIRTEAESRVEMNLHAMEPSLVLMQRDGQLISKEMLAQEKNSIRHMDVASDGTIVTGQQSMGELYESAPLLAIKRPGEAYRPFPLDESQRQMMQQYTASIAIHSELRLLAMTAPRGNRFFVWELDSGKTVVDAPMQDCAGVSAVQEGFVVTSGQGSCRGYDCSQQGVPVQVSHLNLPAGLWDNHAGLLA